MTGKEEVIEAIMLWISAAKKSEDAWDDFGAGYREALLDLEDLLDTL